MKPDLDDESKLIEEWKSEQLSIASQVVVTDKKGGGQRERFRTLNSQLGDWMFGGLDVSFPQREGDQSVATYVVIKMKQSGDDKKKEFDVVYRDFIYFDLKVPYISSFLAFREIEPMMKLIEKQRQENPQFTPSAILVDGNGILHERAAGIACFVGVKTGIRSIGVGKTLYCEDGLTKESVSQGIDQAVVALMQSDLFQSLKNIPEERSAVIVDVDGLCPSKPNTVEGKSPNIDREAFLGKLSLVSDGFGFTLRGKSGNVLACALLGHGGGISKQKKQMGGTKNPIFISVGHLTNVEEATSLCAALSIARIPEPVRQADLWGRELLRNKMNDTTPS